MMFLSQNWYFSVQKALIYYTFNKSHHNLFILLVFSHVANFRYVANFTFLTLEGLWFDPLSSYGDYTLVLGYCIHNCAYPPNSNKAERCFQSICTRYKAIRDMSSALE